MPLTRKRWSEEEERALIDKYGEMSSDGTLAKMKTREKKFRPIAAHVNMMHNLRNPNTFPWHWTWKDASTKVQNMRHQYLLVKQKIKKDSSGGDECFDWLEGLNHWSNFLRYKDVFGDVALGYGETNRECYKDFNEVMGDAQCGFPDNILGDENENGVLGLGLGFEYEEGDENEHVKNGDDEGLEYEYFGPMLDSRRRKKKRLKGFDGRTWGQLENQLREHEARLEGHESQREQQRQERGKMLDELEEEHENNLSKIEEDWRQEMDKWRIERIKKWESIEKESVERERKREKDEIVEKEWEERMEKKKMDWKKKIDAILRQHQVEMDQLQTRILHDQQTVISQMIGIFSQWTGHSTGIPDHAAAGNPYFSQMMQNMHHVNGMVHTQNRVGGDSQEDQFIVDG